ncbi:MAG: ABC transporter ATP-binding protein [Deltaproteobacteria bacterium]|nr:ABC transporter ATP-binding protein [Deltaproteobacteria bacterium]
MALIELKNVNKKYQSGEAVVNAARDITLEISEGSFVAFVGPSGSGKSTLLNLVGCLDMPTSGSISILGTKVDSLDRVARAKFRGDHLGFIFQNFSLIPVLTVYENIEYPLVMVKNLPKEERQEKVRSLLGKVGMLDQMNKYPNQISGGQKQRAAVARALVANPKIVLADEPTANLDSESAMQVIKVMHRMQEELGTTFIFSTHDQKIVEEAEIIYHLKDGVIVDRIDRKLRA